MLDISMLFLDVVEALVESFQYQALNRFDKDLMKILGVELVRKR